MPSSCKDIRTDPSLNNLVFKTKILLGAALAECLQSSDCVLIQRNKPSDCLRHPLVDTLPTRCQQLKRGYGDCKKGMVDMRKRFRGNQPLAVSKSLEGGASEERGQLYAGRSAVEVVMGKTDGKEDLHPDKEEGS